MSFLEISPKDFNENPFTLIGDRWMLITAGTKAKHNTMTASWGGLGVLWGKPVSTMYIRPQRHTLGFVEGSPFYSLCFFDEKYREALTFCGRNSGRDHDKDKETGLTPLFDQTAPYYEQADLVLICRKLYHQDFTPEGFIDPQVDAQNYPKKDYHRMFVGEIVKVLKKG